MHLYIAVLVLGLTQAAEWHTSSGKHCISRCQDEGNGFYQCPAVDGVRKDFRPNTDHSDGGRPNYNPDHDNEEASKTPWDYCTPDHKASLNENDDSGAQTLPANNSNGNQGGHFNTGGRGKGDETALPGYLCEGPCEKEGEYHKCDIKHEEHSRYFCSQNLELERTQLSSHNKLWCTRPCLRNEGDENYMCHTLFGKDYCSPSKDRSSQGTLCISDCVSNTEHENKHYQCYVDDEKTILHDCGYYYNDPATTKALEYTAEDQVCANPCTDMGGEKLCSYVHWNEGDDVSTLQLKEDYCGGETGLNWALVGGIIAGLVLAIILVAVLAFVLVKKPYERANASE